MGPYGDLIVENILHQACETQITVRAAHWVVKLEKLIAGHSLELHICVNFRHILANWTKWTKISHIV